MKNKIELFESKDGKIKLEVNLEQETVWLTCACTNKLDQ